MTVTYAYRSHYQNICYHLGRGDVFDDSGLFLLLFSRVGLWMPNVSIFFLSNVSVWGHFSELAPWCDKSKCRKERKQVKMP